MSLGAWLAGFRERARLVQKDQQTFVASMPCMLISVELIRQHDLRMSATSLDRESTSVILIQDQRFRHPTATESSAFTSSVAQLASAFDC
jgi:hypothetical protein